MRFLPAVAALVAAQLACAGDATYRSVRNFAVDLRGVDDMREATWGCTREAPCVTQAGSAVFEFDPAVAWNGKRNAPEAAGRRVRLLLVSGDLVAWPQGAVLPGRFAGVLVSLHTSPPTLTAGGGETWLASGGAARRVEARADFDEAGTFAYRQHAVGSSGPRRLPIRIEADELGLLGPDNLLRVKLSVWMNSTGRDIHVEATLNTLFTYEEISQ